MHFQNQILNLRLYLSTYSSFINLIFIWYLLQGGQGIHMQYTKQKGK